MAVGSVRFPSLLGDSAQLRAARALIDVAAQRCEPVLIVGESGLLHAEIARSIHALSDRRNGPFVWADAGTLTPSRMAASSGPVVQAQGGVLFVDLVEMASPSLQLVLLELSRCKTTMRAANGDAFTSNARVIAASHIALDDEVRNGRFDEALFRSLSGIRLDLPPLRERREDVEVLARHFVRRLAPGTSIEPAAIQSLSEYAWPGNIRELRNVAECLAIFTSDGVIRLDDLPPAIVRHP